MMHCVLIHLQKIYTLVDKLSRLRALNLLVVFSCHLELAQEDVSVSQVTVSSPLGRPVTELLSDEKTLRMHVVIKQLYRNLNGHCVQQSTSRVCSSKDTRRTCS